MISCERPPGTVCDSSERLDKFFCEASRHWKYDSSGAFYVTKELGERATINLREALLNGAQEKKRVDLGGEEPEFTKHILFTVLSSLEQEGASLSGLYVAYLGPSEHQNIVIPKLVDLGAKAQFVLFEPGKL